MKFQEIYRNCKTQVQETLRSWWITDSMSDVEKQFIEEYIEEYISKVNGDNIVVQSMYPWESTVGQDAVDAQSLVSPLWREKFTPFKHQYKAWETLLNQDRSIVVTTGTGSGKTECFLVPVIKDLATSAANRNDDDPHPVEALFLYPLNALMNDQKERIDKFLYNLADHGKDISFAVYNGNTPEDAQDEDYDAAKNVAEDLAEKTAKKAAVWAGKHAPVLHERYSRVDIREKGSSIMITNPSMLEYMLLREKDNEIFRRSMGKLRWIVIDETHTFTGAAAAELAYLLRRVMVAFDVDPDKVRFVTSSATISGASGQADLKKFISDISGQTKPIEIIEGRRVLNRINDTTGITITPAEICKIENDLYGTGSDNYLTLNSLIPSGVTVEDKLAILDSLTEDNKNMRAKIHFFYPVLDKGAQCRLADCSDLFQMYVCSDCGHLVIAAEVDENGKLIPFESKSEIKDIFDGDENEDTSEAVDDQQDGQVPTDLKEKLISLYDPTSQVQPNSCLAEISKGKLVQNQVGPYVYKSGHVCPCCGKDNKKSNTKDYEGGENDVTSKDFLRLLTCPAAFVGRIISPVLLEQMIENGDDKPHKGQQYISFVDSRQGCSKATLSQNVEVEREWVYSRVYEALLEMDPSMIPQYKAEYATQSMDALDPDPIKAKKAKNKADELLSTIQSLQNGRDYLTWREIADKLMGKYAVDFRLLFDVYDTSKQSMAGNADIKRDFTKSSVTPEQWKARRYAHSIMYYALTNRPKSANAPETLGLFKTYYPKLKGLTVPSKFNSVISDDEWRDLLKVYLDFDVRNNGSFFIKLEDQSKNEVDSFIDIFDLGRYKYAKEKRRPRYKPSADSRIYKLVAKACPTLNADEVIDEMWTVLTTGSDPLLVKNGAKIAVDTKDGNHSNQRWVDINGDGYYLSLYDIAFKLYDSAYICPETKRPLDVAFKNLSPYYTKGVGYQLVGPKHNWTPMPYGYDRSYASVEAWHSSQRTAIHHLWDNRLYKYYSVPMIFVQKEHTAQLDLQEARDYLVDFKERHVINILACSTTMEMGVDVGSLELVVMNNVPPKASNYKQRAGRSGRMEQNRSASIALCGQDVHSRNVRKNPLSLINRTINAPYVDFSSQVILQRQVNAYAFKSVFSHIALGDKGTNVMEFFTNYHFAAQPGPNSKLKVRYDSIHNSSNELLSLASNLHNGNPAIDRFVDVLNDYINNRSSVDQRILDELDKIPCVVGHTMTQSEINRLIQNVILAALQLKYEYQSTVDNLVQYFKDEANSANIATADLIRKVDDYTFAWQSKAEPCFSKLLRGLHYKWTSLLKTNLLEFMSTHQFTPNANMPLDIIELIVSKQDPKGSYRKGKNKQPSADLVRALNQFAPGRVVVINNSVYKVGGVDWTKPFDYYKMEDGYLTIAPSQDGRVVIYPDAFRADYGVSRDTSNDVYSVVNAQFLEMDDKAVAFVPCVEEQYGESPLKLRTSDSWDKTPYVLYYNSGKGQGYSVCVKCGRTVVEEESYRLGDVHVDKNGRSVWTSEHRQLRRSPGDDGRTTEGLCDCSSNDIKHGVIFAGKLQTNFSEILLLKKENMRVEEFDVKLEEDLKILTTFAIILCDVFADEVQRDRSEIDFFISNRGTLCVFDTAKGGAGISTQLTATKIKTLIKDNIYKKMLYVTEPYQILDRNTVRYYDKVDIELFKNWLDWAKELLEEEVPDHIKAVCPNVVREKPSTLASAINKDSNAVIFFNSDVQQYNYYDKICTYDAQGNVSVRSESGWYVLKNVLGLNLMHSHKIHIYKDFPQIVSPAVRDMLMALDGGFGRVFISELKGFRFHPVAYASGRLYFTGSKMWNGLDQDWGSIVYSTEYDLSRNCSLKALDLSVLCGGVRIVHLEDTQRDADDLLDAIIEEELNSHNSSLIQQFIDNSSGTTMSFKYTDEHLKSQLGIILLIKLICSFIRKARPANVGKIEYFGERYTDRSNYCFDPKFDEWKSQANFKYSTIRDKYLRRYFNESGATIDVNSGDRASLPHWRSLEVSNGKSTLVIYPDGGVANGWYADPLTEDVNGNKPGLTITLKEKIKFDIELK